MPKEILTQDAPQDAPSCDSPPAVSPETEAKARAMGWSPKDQFRGDPDKWVGPETFVKRGEEVLPIVNARNRALQQKLEQLEKTLAQLTNHHAKVAEVEYARALEAVRAQQGDAVARGDGEGVRQLRAMEERIIKEQAVPIAAAPTGEDPVFTAWKQDNPWYEKDPELRRAADVYGQGLLAMGIDRTQVLGDVADHIKKLRPSHRPPPSAVEGAGAAGGQRRGGKVKLSDLPPEAQKACKSFVARNVMTEEKYIAEYIKIDPDLKG